MLRLVQPKTNTPVSGIGQAIRVIRMKRISVVFIAAVVTQPCCASDSEFATIEFDHFVKVSLPRSWDYLDKNISKHLNATSEAMGQMAGLPIKQGDNKILVAGSAYGSNGKTRATVRLSVRMTTSPTQKDVEEFSNLSPQEIEKTLMPAATETIKAMAGVDGIDSYKIRAIKIDKNNSLFCMLYRFEGSYGGRQVMSNTWVCPMGDRTLKLNFAYEKQFESVYRPTVEYIWRSLAVQKYDPETDRGFHPLEKQLRSEQ